MIIFSASLLLFEIMLFFTLIYHFHFTLKTRYVNRYKINVISTRFNLNLRNFVCLFEIIVNNVKVYTEQRFHATIYDGFQGCLSIDRLSLSWFIQSKYKQEEQTVAGFHSDSLQLIAATKCGVYLCNCSWELAWVS